MSDTPIYRIIPPLPDTQPQKGNRKTPARTYVPATWAAPGTGGGHPKLSGGYEVDIHGAILPTRGLNRASQTYEQPQSTLNANRAARALAELDSTIILIGAGGEYEVRSESGNQYDVIISPHHCDCPDWLKLKQSFTGEFVDCKHVKMVAIRLANAGTDPLYYATSWVAEQSGFSLRAVQDTLAKGLFPVTKTNGVYLIDPVTAPAIVAYLRAKLV